MCRRWLLRFALVCGSCHRTGSRCCCVLRDEVVGGYFEFASLVIVSQLVVSHKTVVGSAEWSARVWISEVLGTADFRFRMSRLSHGFYCMIFCR